MLQVLLESSTIFLKIIFFKQNKRLSYLSIITLPVAFSLVTRITLMMQSAKFDDVSFTSQQEMLIAVRQIIYMPLH